MKQCITCKLEKELKEFYKDKAKEDGLNSYCKVCSNETAEAYKKTEAGVITTIYAHQRSHSKVRGHDFPTYTKQELKKWLQENGFKELFNAWVASGYKKEFKPSVDRLNDYQNYTLDNIQLVTWKENHTKGMEDIKAGINNKTSKAVIQYSKDGTFIKEFYSGIEASRQTGVDQSNIAKCCKGKYKHAGGFIWKSLVLRN